MLRIVPYERQLADTVVAIERMSFSDPWGPESLLRTLGGEHTVTVVALEADRPVGYACALMLGPEAEVLKVAVLPESQGKGAGHMLLKELIVLARNRRAKKMFIEVRESNRAARILYEKCRFRYSGRRSGYYDNPREDAVIMSLEL